MRHALPLLLLLTVQPVFAQDERRVTSPNGQVEFRLRIHQQDDTALFRLAYEVLFRGQPVIKTSYLGLDIYTQEPILGENVGMIGSKTGGEKGRYNSLIAQYMQNGSLGRLINVEIRVADDGVAFRYVVPRSTPLEELLLVDEVTEFDLAQDPAVTRLDPKTRLPYPYSWQQPGAGWISINETGVPPRYPHGVLGRSKDSILITRLEKHADLTQIAYIGATPMTFPWRVITIAPTQDRLLQSEILRDVGGN